MPETTVVYGLPLSVTLRSIRYSVSVDELSAHDSDTPLNVTSEIASPVAAVGGVATLVTLTKALSPPELVEATW